MDECDFSTTIQTKIPVMNILVCMPIIVNAAVAREAINQIINKPDVTVILCNNGGGVQIENLLNEFKDVDGVVLWKREKNVYVNPIWNDFMEYFTMHPEYDRLIIMNSDLTLQKDWDKILKIRWEMRPGEIIVPQISDDKTIMYLDQDVNFTLYRQIYDGIMGVFITMNQRQVKLVYPIPAEEGEIKVWFGDTWVYSLLVYLGEKVVVPGNLFAYHHHSTSVSTIPGVFDRIEKDKKGWEKIVNPKMLEKFKELKNETALRL